GLFTASLTPKFSPIATGPTAAARSHRPRRGRSAAAAKSPKTNHSAPLSPLLARSWAARSTGGAWPRVRMKRRMVRSRARMGRLRCLAEQPLATGPFDRQPQTLFQADRRLPAKQLLGTRDIGSTDLGVVGGQRLEHDLGLRAGHLDH